MQNKEENRDRKTALSVTDTKAWKTQRQWSELPSPPLEKIYCFLGYKDRVNMSLVCRKWSEGFDSPSVWESFRFSMTESQLRMEPCPVIKLARKYSSIFRHVQIIYQMFDEKMSCLWCTRFAEFMEILTGNSQLISLKFKGFIWCYGYSDPNIREALLEVVAKLLGSQRHLKRVEFSQCFYKLSESLELLRELTKNSHKTITHISLLFKWRIESESLDVGEMLPVLFGFTNLTTLEMDYLVFENMLARQHPIIRASSNLRNQVLSKLILHYISAFMPIDDFKGLTSTDWKILKKRYPNLQVELNYSTHSPSRRESELVVLPNMPITRLNYRFVFLYLDEIEPLFKESDKLFHHLRSLEYNDHLVYLSINPLSHQASFFIPFIQSCVKLRYLKLVLISPIDATHLLIESWLKNPPKTLKEVVFDTSGLDETDCADLMNIINLFASRSKVAGVNVRVD